MENIKYEWIDSSNNKFYDVISIRHKVYVIWQKVPEELEVDKYDFLSDHLIWEYKNSVIATLRLVDVWEWIIKIWRVAVDKKYREQGIWKKIIQLSIEKVKRNKCTSIILESQIKAVWFYEKLWFIKCGTVFMDAWIPHIKMKLDI